MKYEPRNWEKGMPISECIASLYRHLLAYILGLRNEDHMAAIRTNAGFILHFEEEIKAGRLPPTLDDMPHYADRDIVQTIQERAKLNPNLEKKVQAKLDETFADPKTVYAMEDIPKGYRFTLTAQGAWREPGNVPDGVWAIEATALEALPKGAPLRAADWAGLVIGFVPDVGATRISPTGQKETFVKFAKAEEPAPKVTLIYPAHQDEDFITEPVKDRDPGFDPDGVFSSRENGAVSRDERLAFERLAPTHARAPWVGPPPFTIYLCGPITGEAIDAAWRESATVFLGKHDIRCLNPLRGHDQAAITDHGLGYGGQLASTAEAERDYGDIDEADMIFAHFPYAPPRQSIGSIWEMAHAHTRGKPVLLSTELRVFNEHLFTRKFCLLEPSFIAALYKIVQLAGHWRTHNASWR